MTISAEKGYLREVGNLVFHLSLLGLLVAIAVGKLVGYEGSVIVTRRRAVLLDRRRPPTTTSGPACWSTAPTSTRSASTSQLVHRDLHRRRPGHRLRRADPRTRAGADAGTDRWQSDELQVNDPLRMDGERLYLLGHGFTPHVPDHLPGRRRSATTRSRSRPEPNDPNFTSQGAVKVTRPARARPADDIRKQQLAIVGIFAPTAVVHGGIMTSGVPGRRRIPGVAVDVYRGDLGMEGGRSQSVFAIDTAPGRQRARWSSRRGRT